MYIAPPTVPGGTGIARCCNVAFPQGHNSVECSAAGVIVPVPHHWQNVTPGAMRQWQLGHARCPNTSVQ